MSKIRVRVAPSPTGSPHLGTAYQATFNKAFAQKNQGSFVLRIEDTDRSRYVADSEQEIYDSLRWLNLNWDEGPDISGPFGPYRQSERLDLYRQYAQKLVRAGAAYACFCSPERLDLVRKDCQKAGKPPMYDRHCRNLKPSEAAGRINGGEACTIRLKVPLAGQTTFTDLVRGKIAVANKVIDDQVLLKSDGYPTYHLAVVVDDYLMKISHVIRDEGWLSSVPKHILIYQALEWPVPVMAHTPMLRDEQGRKLSKRFGSQPLSWYRSEGFLPEAIKNYLAHLGWSHPDEKEVFDYDEFVKTFTPERIRPTAPVFDPKKLEWMNGYYIRNLDQDQLANYLEPFAPPDMDSQLRRKTVPLVAERMKKLTEFRPLTRFLTKAISPAKKDLLPKKLAIGQAKTILETVHAALNKIPEKSFTTTQIEATIRKLAADHDWVAGPAFMAIRVAVTGQTITPPLFESIEILGKEKTLQRLSRAVQLIATSC